jgi:hypothetical protein
VRVLRSHPFKGVENVTSPEILVEYRKVGEILALDHPGVDLSPILDFVTQNAEVVSAPPLAK